jgi:mannose-1-phosphate guanylyltransferase
MNDQYIVIMAGGRGERFWPESRLKKPKHLLPIVGDGPMLRQTLDRIGSQIPKANIFIITNVQQEVAVRELCDDLPPENIVSEPVGKDTAPAVGLAMVLVKHRNPNGVFAILPADHMIHQGKAFQGCLQTAFDVAASSSNLVTIGIAPTQPATGYGYIHKGELLPEFENRKVFRVNEFVEKPDIEKATEYVNSGQFYWNAGMFVWSVTAIEAAIKRFNPSLYASLQKISERLEKKEALPSILQDIYPALEKISIDFSIMEKVDNVVTIESTFDWDDVGEWTAIERHFEKDESGNTISGSAIVRNASHNLVYNDGKRITALLGVEDLIVVHTADATLICHKSKAQEIKQIVKDLGSNPETSMYI